MTETANKKESKVRYIFVTGGVSSSLGKGIATASLGNLLESRGFKVALMKMDPYINVDPGTMSPFQHGEVYVTSDGAETDLDLGYYNRYTNSALTEHHSISTGKIYDAVIKRERKGDYLGRTVQVIPHITNEIKNRIYRVASQDDLDFVITEIGGTVGDIESIPFLEAIRQMSLDQGRGSVIYVHLTLVPTITAAGEQKTKPTQHSVKELQKLGIQPTILICRTTKPLPRELKAKISLFCNVSEQDVISSTDVKTSIYEAPLMYREEKFDIQVLRHFNFSDSEIPEVKDNSWEKMVSVILAPRKIITIGLAGKYVSLQDAYRSIFEALMHGGIAHQVQIEIKRMDTEKVTRENVSQVFGGIDGILVPGGFGERGIEGKLISIGHARINKIPYLGICLGLQTAVIEFSRNVLHLEDAHTTEINPDTPHPVISLLEEQASVDIFGGTMRLGEYPCELKENTLAYLAYGEKRIMERHRHRYEVNNNYVERLEKAGMCVSGRYPENQLVEIIELANHPWFVATQFHPEFISKPTKPHPLFRDFIGAAVNYNDSRQKEFFPSIANNKNKINAMNEADQ
jgi:CTP synthase